jgi:ParB family chromosome partitioning protein
MIEPPDWLLGLYRQGRCRGMMELYELRRLHGEHPRYIEAWVSDRESITRDSVAALRAELAGAVPGSARPGASALMQALETDPADAGAALPAGPTAGRPRPQPKTNTRLHVEMDGQDYQLVVSVAPAKEGHLYVRPLKGGPRLLAPATALKLRGFVSR